MLKFLHSIRTPQKKPISEQILFCIGMLFVGLILGVIQKYLDISQSELPSFLMEVDKLLDLHNFLGGFSPWIVLAVCISVYSCSPKCAGAGVFLFFAGMVSSYFLYSTYIGGFFPKSYAIIWIGLTIVSPFLAILSWYSKGKGWFATLISAGILGFLINTTFAYGLWYVDIRSALEVMMILLGVWILHKNTKETLLEIGLSIPFAVLIKSIIPYGIWG